MKRILYLASCVVTILTLLGCHHTVTNESTHEKPTGAYYEIFVRSFADSNGDGIGDLNGVTEKLDYLQYLGVKGIWLMPIFSSPSYHGYDVSDYFTINSQYGTLDDFKNLIQEAHKRNIKVILDLVMNHTSSDNEWFIKSEQGDPIYKDYYTWIDPNTDYRIRTNPNSWFQDSNGEAYFAYFGSNMPDLNYSNPAVKEEMYNVGKYWLEQGADGYRLDAAPYIFCDGEDQFYKFDHNITFWEQFRNKMREVNPNVYLVGEVWQDISIYSQFYQGLDSTFNFDLASYIINTARTTSGNYASRLNDYYQQLATYDPDFIDAPFLTNHDQNRVATDLYNGDVNLEKMVSEMLLSLPGNPFIYYGEELGMLGDKTQDDKNVRQPFIWGDQSVETTWLQDNYNQNTLPLSEQETDPNSLFSTYKAMIKVRNDNIALSEGEFFPYDSSNVHLQGYYRVYKDGSNTQLVIVLHNFSNKEDYQLPDFPNGTLIYASYGKNSYSEKSILSQSTVIIELPYNDLSKYVGE